MTATTLLTDALFDGHRFLEGLHLLTFEGALITEVRPLEAGGPPARAVDVRGRTVLPGLINVHAHIARGGAFEPDELLSPAQIARNFRGALAAGITTVADMGCTAPLIGALRARTAAFPMSGPSILASGPLITAPEGYPFDWLPPLMRKTGIALPCATETEAQRAVGRIARAGMDHVKLAVMHQTYAERSLRAIEQPVARAVVEEAHRLGLRVYAHAHSVADYGVALAAGVDALMHSSFEPLDQDLVARVVAQGVAVCPTLWVFESACLNAEFRWDRDDRYRRHVASPIQRSWSRFAEAYAASGDVMPEGIAGGLSKERGQEAVRVASANLRLLRDAGARVAFGNDAQYGFSLVARPLDELSAMERAGLEPLECLRAATTGAAALLGRADRGELAVGKRADVIVVDGDPRRDLSALGQVHAVWIAGQRFAPIGDTDRGISLSVLKGVAGSIYEGLRAFAG